MTFCKDISSITTYVKIFFEYGQILKGLTNESPVYMQQIQCKKHYKNSLSAYYERQRIGLLPTGKGTPSEVSDEHDSVYYIDNEKNSSFTTGYLPLAEAPSEEKEKNACQQER